MKKLINHIQNNAAIYLLVLVVIIVAFIILFTNREEKKETVDTSSFEVVSVKEANKLFNQKDTKVLLIGKSDCSATIEYVPTLKVEMATFRFDIYYLELDDVDIDSQEWKELKTYLDIEYTLNGTRKEFYNFLGNTPMLVIIKNGKMVYGNIGTTSKKSLDTILEMYGVGYEEN